jgi:hypothetical protein
VVAVSNGSSRCSRPWHRDRGVLVALSADGSSMWFTSTSVDQGEYVTSTLGLDAYCYLGDWEFPPAELLDW